MSDSTGPTKTTDQWEAVLEALATANRRSLENGARIAALETTILTAGILLATYLLIIQLKGRQ
jgi:hypothetical protein